MFWNSQYLNNNDYNAHHNNLKTDRTVEGKFTEIPVLWPYLFVYLKSSTYTNIPHEMNNQLLSIDWVYCIQRDLDNIFFIPGST